MSKKYCEIATELCSKMETLSIEKNHIFSAYSSHDPNIVAQINSAIKNLNKTTDIRWVSWEKDMEIENALIFCEICKYITQSKAVLVELSDLNFNVIFEYGYSLGLGKKIHPIVGERFDFKNIERHFQPLLGIGIGKYEQNKLSSKLIKKSFWKKEHHKNVYDFEKTHILNDNLNIDSNSLLYIKNVDSPQVSEEIEKEISNHSIDVIIDDAQEENYNLLWYSKQIKKSFAVIIDLGMSGNTDNFKHFLKCAFICGICIATGRRVLTINSVHAQKPSDIITLIKEYASPKAARNQVYKFLNKHSNDYSVINSYVSTKNRDRSSIFDKINLGEHTAINDMYFIKECFVDIPEYKNLSNRGYKLIIGRKGTGKSASFFNFKSDKDRYREIVIHQLFDKYNLDDIYTLTEPFKSQNDKNKIASSYWHFILLLIIAQNIRDSIDIGDPEINNVIELDARERFLRYFNQTKFGDQSKSVTEYLVDIIDDLKSKGHKSVKEIKSNFYNEQIIKLMKEVITYLKDSDKHLYLNIDGLDSNLSIKKNKELITLILFNLHEVCSNLFGNKFGNFTINLFLRTDLYIGIRDEITEKDKISKIFIRWTPEYLTQIINKRLNKNGIDHIAELLNDDLNMASLMKKVKKYVYDRPRDYVFIFNSFIQIAQAQKKDKIDNKIFSEALGYYTLYVGESIEAEFLSLHSNIDYGEFVTMLKASRKDKDRIQVKKLIAMLKSMEMTGADIQTLISFLLQIKMILVHENSKQVEWNKLTNPDIKLKTLIKTHRDRNFYFHPTIEKLMEDYF